MKPGTPGNIIRRVVTAAVAAVAAAVSLALAATASAATLTVYTAVEAEDLKRYAARFNEDHPDIEIKWVRDSTASSPRSSSPRRTTPRPTSSGGWRRRACCS